MATNVYHIFYFIWLTPFIGSPYDIVLKKMKNPDKTNGANTTWSNAILPKVIAISFWGKSLLAIGGNILQYHTCKTGAIYNEPVKNKIAFLFQSN